MKKVKFIIPVLLCAGLLASCGGSSGKVVTSSASKETSEQSSVSSSSESIQSSESIESSSSPVIESSEEESSLTISSELSSESETHETGLSTDESASESEEPVISESEVESSETIESSSEAISSSEPVSKEVNTFAELKERCEAGVSEIEIKSSFELVDTIFVTDEITITGNVTLTRAATFLGDCFVIGETSEGEDTSYLGLARLTIEGNITFDGNKENIPEGVKGTMFYVKNSAELTLKDGVTVQNTYKTSNERSLSEEKGKLSEPNRVGGPVANVISGTLNLINAVITNNSCKTTNEIEDESDPAYRESTYGGAIFNYGNINIENSTFDNNLGYVGGVICNYRVVTISSGVFEENQASLYGGVLYNTASQYANIIIGGSEEENEGVYFINNVSEQSGGAIFVNHQSSCNIRGNTFFDENSSENGNGGAINATGTLICKGATFSDCQAVTYGGAIYCYRYVDDEGKTKTAREFSIENCVFDGCQTRLGGAVALNGKVEVEKDPQTMVIKNCEFKKNEAENDGDESKGYGGDIYVTNYAELSIETSTFRGSECTDNGGSICASDHSKLTTLNNEFSMGTANNGGAIYLTGAATLSSNGDTFNDFHAYNNGAVLYLYTETVSEIINATFTSNSADNFGGVIYTSGAAHVTLENCEAIGNSATVSGGVIYFTTTDTIVNVFGMKLANNSAETGPIFFGNTYKASINILENSLTDAHDQVISDIFSTVAGKFTANIVNSEGEIVDTKVVKK
ncbi:MAG: hypothetical protein SPL02_00235 [Bacilli bacterium]|nr:hypothetical protein [Bacilli bacterium]MDY6430308.1 hypothetical protein [Bacilli bacterium]